MTIEGMERGKHILGVRNCRLKNKRRIVRRRDRGQIVTCAGKPEGYLYQNLETWVEEGQINEKRKILGKFCPSNNFSRNDPK